MLLIHSSFHLVFAFFTFFFFIAVEKSSSVAGLQSAKSTGDMLFSLHSEASRLNLRRILKSATSELEVEDYSEAKEALLCLSECYSDNMFI